MKQRIALVTGGGRGIGREAALLLSAAGARVMVVSRSEAELAAVGLEYVAADLGTAGGCCLAGYERQWPSAPRRRRPNGAASAPRRSGASAPLSTHRTGCWSRARSRR